jgi:hypothetical protein
MAHVLTDPPLFVAVRPPLQTRVCSIYLKLLPLRVAASIHQKLTLWVGIKPDTGTLNPKNPDPNPNPKIKKVEYNSDARFKNLI